jgi:hypothetical protein
MTNDEYTQTQSQIMLLGALVRDLRLAEFIRRAERADAVGNLFAPSHWIAGHDKLDLVLKLAHKLAAFQAALPTLAEAQQLDADAAARMERLGIGGQP